VINECFQKTAFTLDQCSSTGVLQNMQWGSVSFKGSSIFGGNDWCFTSVYWCHYEIF